MFFAVRLLERTANFRQPPFNSVSYSPRTVLKWSTAVADTVFEGQFVQGGLVRGRTAPGATVMFEGRPVRVAPDGEFLIGFGRDAAPTATVVVTPPGGKTETRILNVAARPWDIQRIEGLPERQVTPPAADLARIRDDQALIAAARERDTPETLFRTGFIWPALGPISGVYGSQRILNGQPRRPHYGVDVAMPTGTPVVAPADGVVSLAHGDMYFTGGTVILDHGHGVGSLYAHLSAVDVAEGTRLRRGERIGAVGATGRATGPHLHWGMTWYALNVDPALVVPPMPAP